jgi:1,4-alpha-glucan branching enzyme
MVSKDTAADYARNRMYTHAHATREICDAADRGRERLADDLSARWNIADNLFAGLDARRMGAA